MIKPITVLSLFDGISCGRLALQRAGIPVEKYYACEIKDIAIKIAKDNFPDNIYLGDVTKVDFTQFKDKIDLVIGGSPCFVAGTKVLTSEQGLKNIEDVKVGDSVLTHKLNWKKVVRTGNKQGNTFRLVAHGITSTVVTENHPYYVKHREREYAFSAPEWVQAKDLKKGDYLHIPMVLGNNLKNYKDCFVEDGFVLVPFRSFTNLEKIETVYNLEVEDDNSYVANGAVVHNCQDCSQANPSRLGLDGPKSSLFFYYAKAVKEANAKHFFLENVDMPGKDLETISRTMGTYPININSSLLSAQQRSRNYWFDWGKKQYDLWGFPTCDIPLPKDKGVTLQSILESGYADKEKQWCLLKRSYIAQKYSSDKVIKGRFDRSMMPICFKDPDCKWESWRWHTQKELERLQTLPDGYTKTVDLWDASDCIGDGWTVDVIAYIFSFLKENLEDLKN